MDSTGERFFRFPMLTVSDIAKEMKVSRDKVVSWIETGKLDAVDIGEGKYHKYRVSEESLAKFKGSKRVMPAKRNRIRIKEIV